MGDTSHANDSRETAVIAALRTVHDPEIPVNIHDLGLIYDLTVDDDGVALVRMTLTAPNCPMAETIVRDVETKVRAVDGVVDARVELVWEPKWTPEMMSEAARLDLEFTGHTGPAHVRGGGRVQSLTIGGATGSRPEAVGGARAGRPPEPPAPVPQGVAFTRACAVGDVPEDSARCIEVAGRRIAVINAGGAFHAIDDRCTHADASLSDGTVSGHEILCPLHYAAFDIRTGACLSPPATDDVASYPVRVTGDDVEVGIAE